MRSKKDIFIWLKKEIPWRSYPSYVLGYSFLYIFLTILSGIAISFLHPTLPELLTPQDVVWYTPFFLLLDAFIEELVFRAPLYIKWLQISRARMYVSIVVASILFGIAHGSIFNVAYQGIAGVLLSILFLKGGGLQRKFWKGLTLSTLTHTFFNCILWALYASAVLSGQTN